jgi:hypothetical protein
MRVFESHKLLSKIEINGMNHSNIRTDVYIRPTNCERYMQRPIRSICGVFHFNLNLQILSICHSPSSRFQILRPTILVSAPQCLTYTSKSSDPFLSTLANALIRRQSIPKNPHLKFDFGNQMAKGFEKNEIFAELKNQDSVKTMLDFMIDK